MIVKVTLDEDTSEWLAKVSSNECRSNAQQVLYWIKRIKAGLHENSLVQHVPSSLNNEPLSYKGEINRTQNTVKEKKEQHENEEEHNNLSTMLDFL